jgi:hypothetical protein
MRRKHHRLGWKKLRRRHLDNSWWPEHDGRRLFDTEQSRYVAIATAERPSQASSYRWAAGRSAPPRRCRC